MSKYSLDANLLSGVRLKSNTDSPNHSRSTSSPISDLVNIMDESSLQTSSSHTTSLDPSMYISSLHPSKRSGYLDKSKHPRNKDQTKCNINMDPSENLQSYDNESSLNISRCTDSVVPKKYDKLVPASRHHEPLTFPNSPYPSNHASSDDQSKYSRSVHVEPSHCVNNRDPPSKHKNSEDPLNYIRNIEQFECIRSVDPSKCTNNRDPSELNTNNSVESSRLTRNLDASMPNGESSKGTQSADPTGYSSTNTTRLNPSVYAFSQNHHAHTSSVDPSKYANDLNTSKHSSKEIHMDMSKYTKLVCLYNYVAQSEKDLSVTRGDWLFADIDNQMNTSWLWVYSQKSNKSGYVPRSYVKTPNFGYQGIPFGASDRDVSNVRAVSNSTLHVDPFLSP